MELQIYQHTFVVCAVVVLAYLCRVLCSVSIISLSCAVVVLAYLCRVCCSVRSDSITQVSSTTVVYIIMPCD